MERYSISASALIRESLIAVDRNGLDNVSPAEPGQDAPGGEKIVIVKKLLVELLDHPDVFGNRDREDRVAKASQLMSVL